MSESLWSTIFVFAGTALTALAMVRASRSKGSGDDDSRAVFIKGLLARIASLEKRDGERDVAMKELEERDEERDKIVADQQKQITDQAKQIQDQQKQITDQQEQISTMWTKAQDQADQILFYKMWGSTAEGDPPRQIPPWRHG